MAQRLRSAKQPRALGVTATIFAAVAGVALAAVVAVSLIAYDLAWRNTAELSRQKYELATRGVAERIKAHLDPVATQLHYLQDLFKTGRITLDNRSDVAPAFLAALSAVPQVSVLAYVSPKGRVWRAFRHRSDEPVVFSDWRGARDIDRLVERARQHAGVSWGPPFVAEDVDLSFLNAAITLERNGDFQGVLIAGISIQELSVFLQRLDTPTGPHAFVLRDRNSVLAHANLADRLPQVSDAVPLPRLGEVGDPVLARLWSGRRDSTLESLLRGGPRVRAVEAEDATTIFVLQEMRGFGHKPLLVGVYDDAAAVTPHMNRLALIAAAGGAALVLAMVAALLLGRAIGRPLKRLAGAFERMRHLDLSTAISPHLGRLREINSLIIAHDAMCEGLRLLRAYAPSGLVRSLIEHGGAPPPEERELTVVFVDIVDFTGTAENMAPAEVATLLNRHFSVVGECVEAEGGVIDKLIGDALMAFWGAPGHQPDHAARACRAVTRIAAALAAPDDDGHGRRLRVAIGIHTGPTVVGSIGAETRMSYTVVGDTVNVAQRLEVLARRIIPAWRGTAALASEETVSQAGGDFAFTAEGRHALRGRHRKIMAYSLRC